MAKMRGPRILTGASRARMRLTDKERQASRSMPLPDRDVSSGRFRSAMEEGGRSRTLRPRR